MKGTRHLNVYAPVKKYFFSLVVILLLSAGLSCTTATENEITKSEDEIPSKVEITDESREEVTDSEVYSVSEAVYVQTFADIELLIDTLNNLIRNSRFEEWKQYLTSEYINYYSSQENLRSVSEMPILKKYNIVLRSLMDYFRYVVVPSRSDVQLDDISFIDDNKVVAYMIIDGAPVVLYTLVKVDGQWMIGL